MNTRVDVKPGVRLKVDMSDVEGKEALVRLQRMVRSGVIVDAEIDEDEAHHTRLISLTDPVPAGELMPRFDFDYRLAPLGKYHTMTWQGAAITYEECLFLYSLVMLMQPRTVVETGTGLALSTLHIAQALMDSSRGELFTVEHDVNMVRRTMAAVHSYGFKECITVVSQDSLKYLRSWARPVDFAFLDSGVSTAEREFELLAPHVRVGGVVVCRHPVPLPGDGQWRCLELPGPSFMHVWSKVADAKPAVLVGAGFNADKAPTPVAVPEPFVPERTDKASAKAPSKAPTKKAAPKKAAKKG